MKLADRALRRWKLEAIDNRVLLSIALLGAPLAWSFHFLASWAIAEWSGLTETLTGVYVGMSVRNWLLIAVSLLSILAAVASTLIAHFCDRSRDDPPSSEQQGAARWAAKTGILNGYVFTVVIAFETIPVLFFFRDS